MAPEIDGKLYLTDLEPPADARRATSFRSGLPFVAQGEQVQPAPGDMATVEITETHDYDLVGRVLEVSDTVAARRARAEALPNPMPRIATGAPLRVLG
jgi:hypothetical protein